ncbi:hypothetical protein [Mycolicibacterium sp.]|uniref:hypothetical protein n=1 Tax=Mycolicibacterium sp. TaxID=2320850 RepID=UPI003560AF09
MVHKTTFGTAVEVAHHRPRLSPIGSPVRHFRLQPELTVKGGGASDVAVVQGFKTTYAFVADARGEVVDWLALATAGTCVAVLAALGYSQETSRDVQGPAA